MPPSHWNLPINVLISNKMKEKKEIRFLKKCVNKVNKKSKKWKKMKSYYKMHLMMYKTTNKLGLLGAIKLLAAAMLILAFDSIT